MVTIEILDTSDPPNGPSDPPPRRGRLFALVGAILAIAFSIHAIVAWIDDRNAAPAQPAGEGAPGSATRASGVAREWWETELPPAGVRFDLVEATPDGLRLLTVDPNGAGEGDGIDLAGPPARLAFGFDGPLLVHQAAGSTGLPLIRITTHERTRTLPSGPVSHTVLLDAAVVDGDPLVVWTGCGRGDTEYTLFLHNLASDERTELGTVPGGTTHLPSAHINDRGVWVGSVTDGDVGVELRGLDGRPIEPWRSTGSATPCERHDSEPGRATLCRTERGTTIGFGEDAPMISAHTATWRRGGAAG